MYSTTIKSKKTQYVINKLSNLKRKNKAIKWVNEISNNEIKQLRKCTTEWLS